MRPLRPSQFEELSEGTGPKGPTPCQLEGRVPNPQDTPLTGLWSHLLRGSKDKSHFHNYSPGNLSFRSIFASSHSGIPRTSENFLLTFENSLGFVFSRNLQEILCHCFSCAVKYVFSGSILVACDYVWNIQATVLFLLGSLSVFLWVRP